MVLKCKPHALAAIALHHNRLLRSRLLEGRRNPLRYCRLAVSQPFALATSILTLCSGIAVLLSVSFEVNFNGKNYVIARMFGNEFADPPEEGVKSTFISSSLQFSHFSFCPLCFFLLSIHYFSSFLFRFTLPWNVPLKERKGKVN